MTIPYRGRTTATTYFVTAGTYLKENVLQSEAMAELFCQVLFRYRAAQKLQLHAFVVMPNHFHLLLTVPEGSTVERVMQLIKGGFSYDAGRLLGARFEIWQKSFVDRRIRDAGECGKCRDYIHENPVRAG